MINLPGIMTGKGLCWLLLACLVVPIPAVADTDNELSASQKSLEQIQQQIEKTLKGLRSKKSESGALSEDLERLGIETRRIERLAKKSAQQLSDLSNRLQQQRKKLQEIEEQRDQTEQQIRQRLVVF